MDSQLPRQSTGDARISQWPWAAYTGFILAVTAREIALGPAWWFLVVAVVCGVGMIGVAISEAEPETDRRTRSGRLSVERVRLTGLFAVVLVVAAVSSMSLDARLSMWVAGVVSLVFGGVAHWRRSAAALAAPLFLTAGVLLTLLGAVAGT